MQAQTAQRVTWFSQIGGPAFEEPRIFFDAPSRPPVGNTQPAVLEVPGPRESQCVSDHTPPSSAVVTDT